MIIGMKPSVFEALNELDEQFILTGSRYFGGYNHESDYDFFCLCTNQVIQKLIKLDFRLEEYFDMDDVAYTDSNCVYVYKHITEPIHIQLVKDMDRKIESQTFLRNFPFHQIEKKDRKYIWDWAISRTTR